MPRSRRFGMPPMTWILAVVRRSSSEIAPRRGGCSRPAHTSRETFRPAAPRLVGLAGLVRDAQVVEPGDAVDEPAGTVAGEPECAVLIGQRGETPREVVARGLRD